MQVASKKVYWKNKCSKHLGHIAIEKDIFSELKRCIFQVSLKYIKLVIPKILLILLLISFNFCFKIMWPPPLPFHQNKNFQCPPPPAKTFLKCLTPLPQAGGRRGAYPVGDLNFSAFSGGGWASWGGGIFQTFGGWQRAKFVKVKFNFSIVNISFRVVSWYQKYFDL